MTFAALVIAAEVILALVASERQWVAPTALFWLVVTAASLCVVTSLALMAVARRNEQPEIGFVALFFLAVSVLPLAHGLTTPGILYGPNTATAASVFWAVPIGMAALAPSLFRSRQIGRWIARRWHLWASAWGLAIFSLAAAMLSWPDLVPVPDMGSATAIGVAAVSAAVCVVAAWRHARLAQIAQRTGPLVVAFGYLIVGTSALVFIAGPPYATHFWFAHAFDIGGVFLATIGGVVVYARSGSVRTILAPVVAYDPHSALEVGLSPVVRKFVADLQLKDRLTRDHVVRCGGHAIDLAVDVGLSPAEVREAGLVGLLHDVGKLEIPDEILKKPGQLTPSEFAVMQTHTTRGHRPPQPDAGSRMARVRRAIAPRASRRTRLPARVGGRRDPGRRTVGCCL